MGIGKDIGNSILGNVETAYLVVDDFRALRKPPEKATSVKKQSAVKKDTATALTKGAAATPPPPPKSQKKYFKVQFNPSELLIDASATAYPVKASATVDAKGEKQEATGYYVKPLVTLSISLVFDDTNLSDAFMSNSGVGGVASTVTNVASAVATVAGKTWSVEPQVLALLSTLHSGYTRFATFFWADFSFCGQIVSVDAEYTMFSTEGRPIRATVNMRIAQELDPENIKEWYDELYAAFSAYSSLVGGAQKVASIFNLNL